MRPDRLPLQLLAGLLALPSALAGFLLLLFAVLFYGNFNFGSMWHCLVFAVTALTPFITLGGYLGYLRHQTWVGFACSVTSSLLIAVTWLLWSSPYSRGLIH